MPLFSQRRNQEDQPQLLQTDDLNPDTRRAIYNNIHRTVEILFNAHEAVTEWFRPNLIPIGIDGFGHELDRLLEDINLRILKRTRDIELRDKGKILFQLKRRVLDGGIETIFDVIELFGEDHFSAGIGKELNQFHNGETTEYELFSYTFAVLERDINNIFRDYRVGYRIVDGLVVAIDNDTDYKAINDALKLADSVPGVTKSIKDAIAAFSDRTTPRYDTAIRESVSAVEAVVRKLTNEGTLADGLKALKKSDADFHPALLDGWIRIYGFTSDTVRHGRPETVEFSQALARYMIVSSSAFISYLLESNT